MITDIIQESTDAIYKFEDDAISIADELLKKVVSQELKQTLRKIEYERIMEKVQQNEVFVSRSSESDMDEAAFAERTGSEMRLSDMGVRQPANKLIGFQRNHKLEEQPPSSKTSEYELITKDYATL